MDNRIILAKPLKNGYWKIKEDYLNSIKESYLKEGAITELNFVLEIIRNPNHSTFEDRIKINDYCENRTSKIQIYLTPTLLKSWRKKNPSVSFSDWVFQIVKANVHGQESVLREHNLKIQTFKVTLNNADSIVKNQLENEQKVKELNQESVEKNENLRKAITYWYGLFIRSQNEKSDILSNKCEAVLKTIIDSSGLTRQQIVQIANQITNNNPNEEPIEEIKEGEASE